MKSVVETVESIRNGLLPYGLYLQKRKTAFPVAAVETEGQHFNFEPFISLVAAFVVAEFFKGFFGKLGGKFAEYLSEKKKHGVHDEELDLNVLLQLLEDDMKSISRVNLTNQRVAEFADQGSLRVKAYLVSVGIPTYKAEHLVLRWRGDLLEFLSAYLKSGSQDPKTQQN
jgi:nicotinic acid phosphoribosyltransferase